MYIYLLVCGRQHLGIDSASCQAHLALTRAAKNEGISAPHRRCSTPHKVFGVKRSPLGFAKHKSDVILIPAF